MKIRALKALNINSLKGESSVDFEALTKDSALFVITGPTGSGKSTLLDIISCALYGQTARLKNPNELMSRHCGEAYCEVEFEIKGRVYRSSWSQKRARKKHDGKFQTAKMELSERAEVLVSGLREVPRRIEELCGLDFGRFSQSMMLAQGGFDAFLKADEKERSALLEKITGTQIYAEISKSVYEQYKGFEQEILGEQKALETIVLLDEVDVLSKSEELKESRAQRLSCDASLASIRSAQHWLEALALLKSESEQAMHNFSEASTLKQNSKAEFERLHLAQRALNIEASWRAKEQLKTSLSVDKSKMLILSAEIEQLLLDLSLAKTEAELDAGAFEKASEIYIGEKEKLKACHNILSKKEVLTKNANELRARISEKERALDLIFTKLDYLDEAGEDPLYETRFTQLEESFNSIKLLYEDKNAQLLKEDRSAQSIVQEEESLQKSLQEDQEALIKVQKNQKLKIDLMQEEKTLLTKRVEMFSHSELLKVMVAHSDELKKHIGTLREKKEREQLIVKYEADRLRLKESEPCSLCGALEHPYAKEGAPNHLDTTTFMLNEALATLESKDSEIKEKERQLSALENQMQNAMRDTEKLKAELLANDVGSQSEETLRDDIEKSKNALEALKKSRLRQDEALKSLNVLREKLQEVERDLNLARQGREQLRSEIKDLEALRQNIHVLSTEMVQILNVADISLYETEVERRYKTSQTKTQTSKTHHERLKIKSDERAEVLKSLNLKVCEDEKAETLLDQEFSILLKENGFSDEPSFQAAILESDVRESLRQKIEKIEFTFTQTQTLQKQSAQKLKTHQEKELTEKSAQELETRGALLKQKSDALQHSLGALSAELALNSENVARHQDQRERLKKQEENFKVWVKLQELIGSADGTKFKKFAQGITLDQLINLANQHLEILSRRYKLLRSEEKLLELAVEDAYQGSVVRSVNTLSGGESFIVSLALALGLSALSSQKIAIDSLFLDEGFGTLDEESLETALHALSLLQSRGKMVGVISHVEALKERIPLQIKVRPNGDGTSVLEVVS